MSYVVPGLRGGDVNPLTGLPLAAGQVLVAGPLATGPRQTVVSLARPGSWPPWITAGPDGAPVDLGTIVGGTWDGSGAYELPAISTTVPRDWLPWALLALLGLFLLAGERKSRGEW